LGDVQAVVLKPKAGAALFPPGALPKPPPNMDDLGASPLGLLMPLPPKRPDPGAAPAVAPPPPKIPPGLLAVGVLDAPPPKGFDAPVFRPPPKRPPPPVLAGVPVLLVAPPNRDGVDPPDVLLGAPKIDGFGVPPLFGCPKAKPDMLRGCAGLVGVVRCCCRWAWSCLQEEVAQLVEN
jgi:hypothetical protein